jgi:hypothetical protein
MLSGSVPPALSWGRENVMPTYRAYLINEDNRVAAYKPVDAATDAEALTAARQFVDGYDVEVWLLDRKIGRLERTKK